jgi:hypothetical protein
MAPEGGRQLSTGGGPQEGPGLPDLGHQHTEVGHHQSLDRQRAGREGQPQHVPVRGKARYQGQQPNIEAIPEVSYPLATLEEVLYLLWLPTVGAGTISSGPKRGQPAPQRENVVKQPEELVHKGGGSPEPQSLLQTTAQSRGHLASTFGGGGGVHESRVDPSRPGLGQALGATVPKEKSSTRTSAT